MSYGRRTLPREVETPETEETAGGLRVRGGAWRGSGACTFFYSLLSYPLFVLLLAQLGPVFRLLPPA